MQQKTTKNRPKSTHIWSKIDGILMKCVEHVPKCNQKSCFFRLGFFNEKNDRKKTILWPLGVEPDQAGKRKALIWIIGSSVEKPTHAEISMRTSRENCQAEVCIFVLLLLLVFAAAWNHSVFAAICCHSMVLAAVVYGDLIFATICCLVLCHLVTFFALCCCFVLLVAICRCWLQLATIDRYVLLFAAICYYLLLFA